MNCYSIAPDFPFLDTLASWVVQRYGQDPLVLASVLILLPNRRACRSLQEAFLKQSDGKPMLLPRIQPIGELAGEGFSLLAAIDDALPPAIAPLRRDMLLARLVMGFEKQRGNLAVGAGYSASQSLELAQKLSLFLDEVQRHNLNLSELETSMPDELPAHWQEIVGFLKILSHHWPAILEQEKASDPAKHQYEQLTLTAKQLLLQPPSYPVIAAGSTGSQPATAQLLKAIASLPQGHVVLPGLDMAMEDAHWNMLDATHPQFPLRHLLKQLGCKRSDVKALMPLAAESPRYRAMREVFLPADATASWRGSAVPMADAWSNMRIIEADTQLDEARMIGVMMRESLQTPASVTALITPDRSLARMVSNQLARFGIEVDDSAGRVLADTPVGCVFQLTCEMIASRAAPAQLLALLRHPLVSAGVDTATCRRYSRQLETELLRGIRKKEGLNNLCSDTPELERFLRSLEQACDPMAKYFMQPAVSLREMCMHHITLVEWLCGDALWASEEGHQLAAFLAELLGHADILPTLSAQDYPELLGHMLSQQKFWPQYGAHPRLHILSPMEARLQHFDHVILAGLNEDSWPALPDADPWMSRPMRKRFGLPELERTIGQSAHDFYLLCNAPHITLTRARKKDGVPTVASRWLMRLTTLTAGLVPHALSAMQKQAEYKQAIAWLEKPALIAPASIPAPCPEVSLRPRKMSVTAFDSWLRDPYVTYARYVLGLKKLDDIDQSLSSADFGTLVHAALEQFIRKYPTHLPGDAYEQLIDCGKQAFADTIDRPAVQALWWPRFEVMVQWLIEQEELRRVDVSTIYAELKGRWDMTVDGKPFSITTSIDRLEMLSDGSVRIIDYKTGYVPSKSEVKEGLANQLPLMALVARYGIFLSGTSQESAASINRMATTATLEYWKLKGNPDKCEIVPIAMEEGWQERLQERVANYIRLFDDPGTPYKAQTNPALLTSHNDYEHLTRRDEWDGI